MPPRRRIRPLDLRSVRRVRRLTQAELAKKSGIDQGRISRLETGIVTDPAWSTVRQLAQALDIDPRELRFGRDDAA